MTIDQILERLEGVTRSGSGYQARCPAHEDRVASLSIDEGYLGPLVHCHAGCDFETIMAAIQDGDSPDEPEAVYTYTDEDGNPLYEVVRFPGKKFRQRTPDGDWGLRGKNVRRVLYRLDLLVATNANKTKTYVVEGEKDADALIKLGLLATTNSGGAGKWEDEYSEYLRGREVIIVADTVPDNGIEHAKDVARSLDKVAAAAKIVLPKVDKDASDHLAAGFGVDEFIDWDGDIWKESFKPDREPKENRDGLSVVFANQVEAESPEFLDGDGRVPYGGITFLIGMPGLGKSTLLCFYAARTTQSGSVALISSYEDSYATVMKPRLAAAGADLSKVGLLRGLTIPDDVDELEKVVRKHNVRLLGLDPLMAHLANRVDSNQDKSTRRALAPLHDMAERCKCAVVVLLHLNKGQSSDPMLRASGSLGGLMGAARSAMELEKTGEYERVLTHFKSSWGEHRQPTDLVIEGRTVELDGKQIQTSALVKPRPFGLVPSACVCGEINARHCPIHQDFDPDDDLRAYREAGLL